MASITCPRWCGYSPFHYSASQIILENKVGSIHRELSVQGWIIRQICDHSPVHSSSSPSLTVSCSTPPTHHLWLLFYNQPHICLLLSNGLPSFLHPSSTNFNSTRHLTTVLLFPLFPPLFYRWVDGTDSNSFTDHLDCPKPISLAYQSIYDDGSGIGIVGYWNHLSWASESHLCGPLPNSGFSDITLVVWNQPWWEYLCHGNQMLQSGLVFLFSLSLFLFWERQKAHSNC